MKETLDEQSRQDLIRYRIDRAKQTVEEAEGMLSLKFYNAAVNRLYYAVFYAAEALLLAFRIRARTHAGVKSMLGLHFVSKGLLPLDFGRTFNDLFSLRHSGDYEDFVYCDRDTVEEYIPKAKKIITEIENLIKNKDDDSK